MTIVQQPPEPNLHAARGATRVEEAGLREAPVFQTAAFSYQSAQEMADVFAGRAPGHLYTRLSNPTTLALERRLAHAENGIGCIATSSGMAALTAVVTGLLRPGDELVSASGIFGGTVSLFRNLLGRFGVRTHFVDPTQAEAVQLAVTPATRAIFVETIGNQQRAFRFTLRYARFLSSSPPTQKRHDSINTDRDIAIA